MSASLVWRRGQAGLADWKHLGWAGWSAATVSSAATICFIAVFKNTALEVPLAPLWSWLILSEIPRMPTVAGGAVVLVTLAWYLRRETRVRS